MDFLSQDNDADFVGHETKENSLLVGFDLAFRTPRRRTGGAVFISKFYF